MAQKFIGILGAAGCVGKGVLKGFLKEFQYPLLLGGRDLNKLELLKNSCQINSDLNLHIAVVDVYDQSELRDFCERCCIVINCTAPSTSIGKIILEECVFQKISYIDPFGEGAVEAAAMEYDTVMAKNHTTMLTSAGAYPGLTEYLTAYIMKEYFDSTKEIEVYFSGNGAFSNGAAKDIVASMKEGQAKAMCIYESGNIQPLKLEIRRKRKLPEPVGEVFVYPVLQKSFYEICRKFEVKKGAFFNTFHTLEIISTFFEIGAKLQFDSSINQNAVAENLSRVYNKNIGNTCYTAYTFITLGTSDQENIKKTMLILYPEDWNVLSGVICASLAKLIFDHAISCFGYLNFSNMEPHPLMINQLKKQGMEIHILENFDID